jgi:predicted ATPase
VQVSSESFRVGPWCSPESQKDVPGTVPSVRFYPLDGIALAIELAAGRVEAHGIEGIVHEIADIIASLVAKSLVVSDTGGERQRYRLLDTTRAYLHGKVCAASPHSGDTLRAREHL